MVLTDLCIISCLFQNKSIAVSHISLSVVKVIAQKCVNILRGFNHTDCTLRNILSKEQMAELVTTFKDTVTKVWNIYGPGRDNTCLQGFQQSEIQTSLLSYRD